MRFKVITEFNSTVARGTRFKMVAFTALCLAAMAVTSCNRSDQKKSAASAGPSAIEPIEGMKYYVGGPVMKYDKYERLRMAGFNGEVTHPTSRGLLLGFKKNEDNSFNYKTWLNGVLVSESEGFLDADGLLWYRQRKSYDANGALVVRQKFSYDDENKIMTSTVEDIDPTDGVVVKTVSEEVPYTPPPTKGSTDEADGDDFGPDSEDAE